MGDTELETTTVGGISGNPTDNHDTASALANGVQMMLRRMEGLLDELTNNQQSLLSNIEQQNESVTNNEHVNNVHKTMIETHHYYKKLMQIRKDMHEIHARTAKLKNRASKLESQQRHEANVRQRRAQRQLERDRRLIAKPASNAGDKK